MAHVTQPDPAVITHVLELYDSRAMYHMTPLREPLVNCWEITPKPINAANQCTFSAIGCRNMIIHVPNSHTHTKILLWDVLHTPDITQTLVSIGCISNAGYSITFKDGTCTIHNVNNVIMGRFPKRNDLYQVNRGGCWPVSAHSVRSSLTIHGHPQTTWAHIT